MYNREGERREIRVPSLIYLGKVLFMWRQVAEGQRGGDILCLCRSGEVFVLWRQLGGSGQYGRNSQYSGPEDGCSPSPVETQ